MLSETLAAMSDASLLCYHEGYRIALQTTKTDRGHALDANSLKNMRRMAAALAAEIERRKLAAV